MSFLNPKKSIFFAIGILFFGLTLNAYAANPVPGSATLPQGGSSPTNNVTYSYSPDGKTLNQNSTGNSISNFGSMSVGAGYTWNINQPSSGSTSLNRCFNCDQSIFNGPINSNGRIIFVNNNGIIFGRGSVVNAPSIIASTLDISDTDFLNGNYKFFKNGGNAFIINQGRISAQPGGFVALLSQAVNNQGVILADSGSIALASGNKMTVALDTLNQISVTVDEAVQSEVIGPDGQQIKSAINNSGTIQANGGKVLLTAKVMNDVFDYAVNNTGVITAGALVNNGGVVEITASGAPVVNTGSITANAVNINVQNANLVNNGSIVASLLQGQANTGNISINALNIFQAGLIAADAEVDVTAVEAIEATDPIGDSTPSSPSPVSNLIKGNDVNLVASQFGSPDAPLNIDATNIDITLTQGNINIGSSLSTNSVINLRAPPTGPPSGIVSISYNSDANLVLNASTGSINVAPQAEVSANNLTLTAQDGIYSYGSLTATNTLTLLSPAGIYSLGSLQSADLYERGATFQVGGIFNPGYADVKNADNAMEFSGNATVSGTVTDGTDIIIDAGVTLTMTADTNFVAATGAFTMDPTSTIAGGGFNLSISALSASTLGNISGVNLLTLSAVSSSPVTFTSNSSSTFQVNTVQTNNGTMLSRSVGTGTAADPIMIYSDSDAPGGLEYIGDTVKNPSGLGLYYEQANNINAAETASWNAGAGFVPIGNASAQFTGSFNGNNLAISNLTINTTSNYAALFGYIYGATLSNIQLINVNVTGSAYYVAGLAGESAYSTITNSFSTGSVNETGSGYEPCVGGLVGGTFGGSITDSYSTANVNSTSYDVGGLVGETAFFSTITNSYSTGNVTGQGQDVGGLVGLNGGSINNAYSTGNVSGNYVAGGLVGDNSGSITNAYSSGNVTGWEYLGGLVGVNTGSISNSFTTGNVSGGVYALGGLVGESFGGSVTNSYYTDNIGSAGGTYDPNGATDFYSLLNPVYAAWDFSSPIWSFPYGGGLPLLTQTSYVWIGTTSTNWFTPSNWLSGIVPAPGASIIIDAGAYYPVLTSDISTSTVLMEPGAAINPGIFTISGNYADIYGTLYVNLPFFNDNYAFPNGTFEPGSTVNYAGNYSGSDYQTIMDPGPSGYSNLVLSGSGNKVLAGDTLVTENFTMNSGTNLDGAFSLTVDGNATINGAVGSNTPLTSLEIGGTTAINTTGITTTGSQTYSGAVTLGANAILTGTGITFGSTLDSVDGGEGLTINDPAITTFNGPVGGNSPLAYLFIYDLPTPVSDIVINTGLISTVGDQYYGKPVTLETGSTTLTSTGGNITFTSTVNGANNLTINDNGLTTFDGAVGGIAPLAGLTVNAADVIIDGNITVNGGNIFVEANNGTITITGSAITDYVASNGSAAITFIGGDIIINDGNIEATVGVSTELSETASISMTASDSILIDASLILARMLDANAGTDILNAGTTTINLISDGVIGITDSTVKGNVQGNGISTIYITANDGITINGNSNVTASVPGAGTSTVNIASKSGTIVIDASSIDATGLNGGNAAINIMALNGGISIVDGSSVSSTIIAVGNAAVTMVADGPIAIANSGVSAYVAGDGSTANITILANGTIMITDSGVAATIAGLGTSIITIGAGDGITINDNSNVADSVHGSGTSTVNISAESGDITIDPSSISATVLNGGSAAVTIIAADGDINIVDSGISALVVGLSEGSATVTISADGAITINGSPVTAYVSSGAAAGSTSTITIGANGAILITDSDLAATIACGGTTTVTIEANGAITIAESDVTAYLDGDGASNITIAANGGGITIDPPSGSSTILAKVQGEGTSTVDIIATNGNVNIMGSAVTASVAGEGSSAITIAANGGSIIIGDGNIEATVGITTELSETASVSMTASDSIIIDMSTIFVNSFNAYAGTDIPNGGSTAINIISGDVVSISDSTIKANVQGNGISTVTIAADDSIIIDGNSNVTASVPGAGTSTVNIMSQGGIIIIDASSVDATGLNGGNAAINIIESSGSIYIADDSSISSTIIAVGNAAVTMVANGPITIDNSGVSAYVAGDGSTANITILANSTILYSGTMIISDSSVLATIAGLGTSIITIGAGDGITINDNSNVADSVHGSGTSTVNITADTGKITIDPSSISATVLNGGSAAVTIIAGDGNINVIDSGISALVVASGSSTVSIIANGAVVINDGSSVSAYVAGDGSTSAVTIAADGTILITDSSVLATVAGIGTSTITIEADDAITINGDSNVIASVHNSGASTVSITASSGEITIDDSLIHAESLNSGSATVNIIALDGGIDITDNSVVSALVVGPNDGSAIVTISADGAITINDSQVTAYVSSGAAHGSTSTVTIEANGAVSITGSDLAATIACGGIATVTIEDSGAITIADSDVIAYVDGNGASNIAVTTGDITIWRSKLEATLAGSGKTTITLNADGSIKIAESKLKAEVGEYGKAAITIDATGNITIWRGKLEAEVADSGKATIELTSGAAVKIIESNLEADIVTGNGTSTVTIQANGGNVTITNGDVKAIVGGTETAIITITATGSITIDPSAIIAQVGGSSDEPEGPPDPAEVIMTAGTSVTINDSTVVATVAGDGNSSITITAGGAIGITDSGIIASVEGDGASTIGITANGGDITVTGGTIVATVSGTNPSDSASVSLSSSGDIIMDTGSILAIAQDGSATVNLQATGAVSITNSNITADAAEEGPSLANSTSLVTITANGANGITITDSAIIASVPDNGTSTVTITANGANGITITGSDIIASVPGDGASTIGITANGGDITITNDTIEAEVGGSNPSDLAGISLAASGNITIDPSVIVAQVLDGSAMINLTATTGAISITNSDITALVTDESGTGGFASITMGAGTTVTIDNNDDNTHVISVDVAGDGTAGIIITAYGGDITVTHGNIDATVGGSDPSDLASILMPADGNITLNSSIISSQASDSSVSLFAFNGSIIGVNDGPEDIQTQNLNLAASDSIYGDYIPTGIKYIPATNGFLTTDATNIYARAANNIQLYDTGSVTLNVAVSNMINYGNVILEALNGDIIGLNANAPVPDILSGNLYLNASGSIYGNYPTTGGSLTTNASYYTFTVGLNGIANIVDTLVGGAGANPVNASSATIDIVSNGTITADYVSAFKNTPPAKPNLLTPEPILLGGGVNAEIQTAAGGVSYNHGLGSGYEAQPTFFFYHPLTDIDGSAFDNIVLDAGAYDFIEDELKNFKGVVPSFFGTP